MLGECSPQHVTDTSMVDALGKLNTPACRDNLGGGVCRVQAILVNEQWQLSRQYWGYLKEQGARASRPSRAVLSARAHRAPCESPWSLPIAACVGSCMMSWTGRYCCLAQQTFPTEASSRTPSNSSTTRRTARSRRARLRSLRSA